VSEECQPEPARLRLRNSVKAIIVEDGRLLVLKKRGKGAAFYVLPGGTQKPGETLPDALVREVREEVGAAVEVGNLKHVRDYIARHHEFHAEHAGLHRVEFWFECRLLEKPGTAAQTHPDRRQVSVEWLELCKLAGFPLYPRALKAILVGERKDAPVYLGDVN